VEFFFGKQHAFLGGRYPPQDLLILIPVFVAAFDALNIAAISVPGREMLAFILNKLPAIFAAAVIIILAIVMGKILQKLLSQVVSGVGILAFNNRYTYLKWGI
jgi:hypothetical protein